MPIQFNCQCGKLLSVDDAYAGKSARCPQCQTICQIPAANPNAGIQQTAAPIAGEAQYYVINASGQSYGPVTQSQLEGWVAEGRVAANDMLQQVGTQSQVAASQMFPSLLNVGIQSSYGQPAYGTPAQQRAPQTARVNRVAKSSFKVVVPTFEVIWRNAVNTFKPHWGILVAASFIVGFMNGILNWISNFVVDGLMDQGEVGIGIAVNIGFFAISTLLSLYFGCGFAAMTMNLLRGKKADLGMLFTSDALGRTLVCMIPIWIGVVLPPIVAAVICFSVGVETPVMLIVIASVYFFAILVSSMMWPVLYLSVDNKASFPGIYSTAMQITVSNIGNCIVILILFPVIMIAGALACCIGVIPAGAFLSLLPPTAYLAMTNQLR